MSKKNQPERVKVNLPPIPVVPKSLMTAARTIAANPPEHLFQTPDGTLSVRADQLTEDDINKIVAGFVTADDADRENFIRFMLSAMKGIAENRQRLADELIKFGEIMENFYKQVGFKQPD